MVFKECGPDGAGIRLARVSNLAICAKALITYVRLNVQAPNILAADVFGTGIFH
jgi:hypothetical protein